MKFCFLRKQSGKEDSIKKSFGQQALYCNQTAKPQKSKAPAFADAFDWDGMGGNIGGLSVFVLALDIRYLLLV